MSLNGELVNKMTLLTKLFYMQVRPNVELMKKELLKTSKQEKAYQALDGVKTIKEIAKFAGYSSTSSLEEMLPEWEKRGFILSTGQASTKRYINIENLGV